jgi:hypothetical protein
MIRYGAAIAFVAVALIGTLSFAGRDNDTRQIRFHSTGISRIADTHAEICAQNRDQCLKGCDGAESCSNQCETNYQGCMAQGQ